MKRVWAGEKRGFAGRVGPPPVCPGGPTVLIGGRIDTTFRRAATYGDGWIMGGGSPEQFRAGAIKLDKAWSEQGRDGQPRKIALAYFALGPDAEEQAASYLRHFYAWLTGYMEQIASKAVTDEQTIRGYVSAFQDVGCDELIFIPSSTDVEQVDLLAAATL